MYLRLWIGLILLASGIDCLAQLEPVGCLSYEPSLVALHGTLTREDFPGPPNYQDTGKGDKAETYWFVKLDSPICVNEGKSDPNLNPRQKNIHRVQLVFGAEAYGKYSALLGKKVVASGTLFGKNAPHHHTPVLLTVNYLDLPRWK
jgi:hypothetical protein